MSIGGWNEDELERFIRDRMMPLVAAATSSAVVNARKYGAKGDGGSDDTAGLQRALNACREGGTVFLPAGIYMVSASLEMPRNVTLAGEHAPRWPYRGGSPSVIRAMPGFTGSGILNVRAYSITGLAPSSVVDAGDMGDTENDGGRVYRIALDGNNESGSFNGVYMAGECRDWRFIDVAIRRTPGSGFRTVTSSGTVRGLTLSHVVVDRSGNNGFSLNQTNDSHFHDCLAVANANDGFSIATTGENNFVGCRAVFNHANGFNLTSSSIGSTFTGCSTDRNEHNGFLVAASGSRPVTLAGCAFRRDGRNGNGGGGSYAGLAVFGATAPVVARGVVTMPGVDDDGSGTNSPQYGAYVAGSTMVSLDGYFWGNSTPIGDGGSNTYLEVTPDTHMAVGVPGSATTWRRRLLFENYAASYTPNPVKSDAVVVATLTGGITVNAPSPAYRGQRLQFVFTQDGTGGRAVTWDAVFKVNWSPDTSANKKNTIEFLFDGTNWIQTAAATGL